MTGTNPPARQAWHAPRLTRLPAAAARIGPNPQSAEGDFAFAS